MYCKIQYNPRSCLRAIEEGTRGPAQIDQELLPADSEWPARPLLRPAGPLRRSGFSGDEEILAGQVICGVVEPAR